MNVPSNPNMSHNSIMSTGPDVKTHSFKLGYRPAEYTLSSQNYDEAEHGLNDNYKSNGLNQNPTNSLVRALQDRSQNLKHMLKIRKMQKYHSFSICPKVKKGRPQYALSSSLSPDYGIIPKFIPLEGRNSIRSSSVAKMFDKNDLK